jgi:hypothetical protein
MAQRIVFKVNENGVSEELIDFFYIKGMSYSQKIKNVKSFHRSIAEFYPNLKVLEVSSKSIEAFAKELSAFKLKLKIFNLDSYIENIYQSSKVFEKEKQHPELLSFTPLQAKRFFQELDTGNLVSFKIGEKFFPIDPPSAFYDFLYINALNQNKELASNLLNYSLFTDIEFNQNKQISTQARAAALYVYLVKFKRSFKISDDFGHFLRIYKKSFINKI